MGAIAWERLEQGSVDGLQLDIRPGTDRTKAYRSERAIRKLNVSHCPAWFEHYRRV